MAPTVTLSAPFDTDRDQPGAGVLECCPLSEGPLDAPDAQRLAGMLKALGEPMRLRLLSHVAAQGCAAVCSCLLYTSPSPRDLSTSRMPSSA